MMRNLMIILLAYCSAILSVNAQIVIDNNDMPFAGDTVRMSFAVNTANFDFSQTGPNSTWDFRALMPATQLLDTFKTVSETPVFFWPSFFASSNLALRLDNGELLPGLVLDDAYQFYHRSTSAYKDFGYGIILSGIPLPLKFTTPDLVYTFPLTADQSYESLASLEFSLPDLGYISIERQRQTTVDGWGTLMTPYGNFEVIKLKSVVAELDSIYADTAGQGIMIERNYIEYKWLAKNHKVPLLQCVEDQILGTTVMYKDSLRDLTVGIKEIENQVKADIFPNPVEDYIYVSVSSDSDKACNFKIFDSVSRLIYEEVFFPSKSSTTKINFNFSKLPPGLYLVDLQQNDYHKQTKIILQR